MKKFTKNEICSLIVIFLILLGISIPNFIMSIKRSRDQIRRDDLGALQTGLEQYYLDYHGYPPNSPDGRMIACNGPCTWGQDNLVDLNLGTGRVYMKLPADPQSSQGVSYVYYSDGGKYQIISSLEDKMDVEYDNKIVTRNIMCGNRICNVGRALNCPIDRSIGQYDNEIQVENIRKALHNK